MTEKKNTRRAIKAPATPVVVKKQLEGFKDFIKKQGLIGMATGLIIGTAAATLVKSLIDNVIMPPLGILLGSTDGLKGLVLNIQTANGVVAVKYGVFLNDLVNFLIIAAVVYGIIIAVTKFLGEERVEK